MVVDAAEMLPAHSTAGFCRGAVGSGSQSPAPFPSPLQPSPKEDTQPRGYGTGTPSSLVVL